MLVFLSLGLSGCSSTGDQEPSPPETNASPATAIQATSSETALICDRSPTWLNPRILPLPGVVPTWLRPNESF